MFKVQFTQVWNDDIVEKDNSVADTIYDVCIHVCVCMRVSVDFD